MKANYDPRYVAPHTKTWPQPTVLRHPATLHHSTSTPLHHATSLHHKLNGYASLHSRLNTMRDIYGVPTDQSLRGSLQASARLQTKHHGRQVNIKAGVYIIWCGANRLSDCGVHTLGDTSAFVNPVGQLLLTRRGKTRMDGIGIVFEFYIAPL